MKKLLTFLLVLCLGTWAYAQRDTYFAEDFNVAEDDGSHAMSANWNADASAGFLRYMRLSKTTVAAGDAPEAVIGYYPSANLPDVLNGTFQLVSNAFSTKTGKPYVTLKYAYTATKRSQKKNRSFSVLARRGSDEWVTCATIDSLAAKIPASVLCAALPAEFEKADSVQVALQLNSAKDGVSFIFYVDDVTFFSLPADWYAAEAFVRSSLNIRNGVLETLDLQLKNTGNPIRQACTLSYRWDGGEVYTKGYEFEAGIAVDASVPVVLAPEGWDPTAWGAHEFEVWISAIDGETLPEAAVVKQTYTFSNVDEAGMFDKRILVEEFSSATCGPCAAFNRSVFNPAFEALGDSVTLVKYQMNWPGSGDKYYIEEGGARRDYYGVTGVPTLVVEGKVVSPDNDADKFMAYMRRRMAEAGKTYFNIVFDTVAMDCETKHLTAVYKIETKGVLANAKIQTVVMERETKGNVASNGETSFHHVMLAMLPGVGADANTGLTVDLKSDTVYTFAYTLDMGTTHMEECDDLLVACFLQTEDGSIEQSALFSLTDKTGDDDGGGTIANEAFRTSGVVTLYPNPASDVVRLQGLDNAAVELYDLAGRLQFSATGVCGDYLLEVRNYMPGVYIVRVREGHSVSSAKLHIVR